MPTVLLSPCKCYKRQEVGRCTCGDFSKQFHEDRLTVPVASMPVADSRDRHTDRWTQQLRRISKNRALVARTVCHLDRAKDMIV